MTFHLVTVECTVTLPLVFLSICVATAQFQDYKASSKIPKPLRKRRNYSHKVLVVTTLNSQPNHYSMSMTGSLLHTQLSYTWLLNVIEPPGDTPATPFNNSPRVARYCCYHNVGNMLAFYCSGNVLFPRRSSSSVHSFLVPKGDNKSRTCRLQTPCWSVCGCRGLHPRGCHSMGIKRMPLSPLTSTLSNPLLRCSLQAGPLLTQYFCINITVQD